MKSIVVASQNPVKIKAALVGFQQMLPQESFQIEGISVDSGESDQPRSDSETLRGAITRAQNAARIKPISDYWVGIEGGVSEIDNEMAAFAWVIVLGKNLQGKGRSGTFFLPEAVARLVREGLELGKADDIIFNTKNSKQENGAVGLLTGNVVDRARLYEQAVIFALIPLKNVSLYSK